MRTIRRALLLTLGLVLTASLQAPAVGNTVPDEQYVRTGPPVSGAPGYIGAFYDDAGGGAQLSSYLLGGVADDKLGMTDGVICDSFSDPNCAKSNVFSLLAHLVECASDTATNCVSAVTAIKADGTAVNGKFIRRFPAKGDTDFIGSDTLTVPSGGSPGIWTFDGVSHQGGSEFYVAAQFVNERLFLSKPTPSQLRVAIYPVSEKPLNSNNSIKAGVVQAGRRTDGGYAPSGFFPTEYVASFDKTALLRWPFPADLRFRVELKLKTAVSGWITGRLVEPTVKIANNGSTQIVTVEGTPSSIPVIDAWTKWVDAAPALRDIYAAQPSRGTVYFGKAGDPWDQVSTQVPNSSAGNDYEMKTFLEWVKVAGDKAAATYSTWSFRSLDAQEQNQSSECFASTKRVTGIVSTNATKYIAGPPTFNKQTQTLDYKVASPHFNRTGGLNIGTYTLAMPADVARCVYGFRDAPISATVSIVSANGEQQVATTNVANRDGWLYLSAYGFTFSSPTVSVKLTQEPAPVVVKPVVTKKSTITCTKGKTSKKFNGTKCPSGWKKKS